MIILPSVNSGIVNSIIPQDADARNYIYSVEVADNSVLEFDVRKAINDFIVGCKNDNIWTAIKSCCLLAGPKTLNGALTPLVGTAPTNVNFISSDYTRKTGLKGDGSSKYLNSNRANNSDPQDSKHLAVYISENFARTTTESFLCTPTSLGGSLLLVQTATLNFRINYVSGTLSIGNTDSLIGLYGASRSSNTNVNIRYNSTNSALTDQVSTTPATLNTIHAFVRPLGAGFVNYSNARLAFYSIGENIDLEKLDNRVKTYINTLASLNI